MVSCFSLMVIGAICSLDTVVGVVRFEQSLYEIVEDIGLEDFALRVCVLADENSRVTIATSAGTATESEDFDRFNEVIDVEAGSEDGCFAVIIWEDQDPEDNEQFTIAALDEFGGELGVTTVTIVNDDNNGIFVRFIDGTPRVVANTVMFSLELGPEVEQATCSVVLTSSGARTDVDCSSGSATISRSGRGDPHQAIASVSATGVDDSPMIVRDIHLGVRRRCTVNLIDDGVVIDNISRDVTVTFRLTEQDGVDPSMVTIRCTLSGPTPMGTNICNSPLVLPGRIPGNYVLSLVPNKVGGCSRGIERSISFTV